MRMPYNNEKCRNCVALGTYVDNDLGMSISTRANDKSDVK